MSSDSTQTADGHTPGPAPQQTAADRKYADIIDLPRPQMHHQRMDPLNRAKIFAPFDALRGFDEEIEEVDRQNSVDSSEEYTDEDFV